LERTSYNDPFCASALLANKIEKNRLVKIKVIIFFMITSGGLFKNV
jgi:hypothetical protein